MMSYGLNDGFGVIAGGGGGWSGGFGGNGSLVAIK